MVVTPASWDTDLAPGSGSTVSIGFAGNESGPDPSATQSSTSAVTVAPYSLTVIQVPGSGGTGVTAPGAPGTPTASNLSSTTAGATSGTATLTWPAAAAGTYPVAGYRVYRQTSGGGATLVGSPAGTTLKLSGLTIGAGYTYDVVAVDSQGNTSLPSPTVTFTVPPPASATCAVHYAISSSWPGGFGASITVTNNAADAIDNWTLTFAWAGHGMNLGTLDYQILATEAWGGGSGNDSVTIGGTGTPTSAPPTTAPPTTASPTAPAGGSGTCKATYSLVSSWSGGYQASVTVADTGLSALSGWSVGLSLANGQSISSLWSGVNSGTTGAITVKNAPYNDAVAAGGSTTFGFTANGDSSSAPTDVTCVGS